MTFTNSAALTLAGLAAFCCGCQGGSGGSGALRVESSGAAPAILPGRFTTAVYEPNPENIASFYLYDGDVEALLEGKVSRGQYLHVELLWQPRAGRTPVDRSSLNASVRHVVFVDGEFGIYGGGGFARLSEGVGAKTLTVAIPEASLTLLASSPNFVDPLSPAELTGRFTAILDERMARRLSLGASQAVTNRLGRSMHVRADSPIEAAIAH